LLLAAAIGLAPVDLLSKRPAIIDFLAYKRES
jgi:hypothetical protein